MGQSLDKDHQDTNSDQADSFLVRIPAKHKIDRVARITPSEFEEKYYNKDVPVIITDFATHWPAFQKWSIDYLDSKVGNVTHTFRYGRNTIDMKVSDYIQRAKACAASEDKTEKFFPEIPDPNEKLPYIRHFGPLTKYPELNADISPRDIFINPDKMHARCFIFMGVPKTTTNPHYDDSSNFVAIISGTKHIALLPPGGEQEMNVTDKEKNSLANFDAVFVPDPDNLLLDCKQTDVPDDAIMMHEHPVFKNAKSLQYAPLRAGEMVFIPKKWYHYIHNVDFSVSVTVQTSRVWGN